MEIGVFRRLQPKGNQKASTKFQWLEEHGKLWSPFPNTQPMKLYSSIWNADEWATRGGLIKTDWTQAPFSASYRNFHADACVVSSSMDSACGASSEENNRPWLSQKLDPNGEERLKWVQKNHMLYDYCADAKRFPQGFPGECSTNM